MSSAEGKEILGQIWRPAIGEESFEKIRYSRLAKIAGEQVSIEVSVSWRDASRTHVRVQVTANGPSTWRMQRVVEHIDLPLGDRSD